MPVIVTGQYTDPSMTVRARINSNNSVEYAVGRLRTDVAKRVTENLQLEPRLEPTMLEAKVFPSSLDNSDNLSILPKDISLRVLFGPAEGHKDLVKTHMSEMKRGMGKMTEALDAIDKMNKAIEKMNTSIEGLTTENKELKKECKDIKKECKELKKENQKMNTSIEGLTTENKELKKENRRMDMLMEKLNTSIEGLTTENEGLKKDVAKLSDELSVEKRCRSEELDAIRQLTLFITPIHLRVLLDLTRQQILKNLEYDTWEDLRKNRLISELTGVIYGLLPQVAQRPSYETIEFVCAYNNIRRDGNAAAHHATQEEMREAVTTKKLDTKERRCLEEMYRYVFGTEV
ncbi:hypothetical protein BYT27DRAFT_7201519 [Phlegmacium glaucopus]|nr:hypothetical protein BYT27DRAFT_7201519 [Phlegmacium glaucopus]